MKFMTRNVTVNRYSFGKINLSTGTVEDTTAIVTVEQFSERKIAQISIQRGAYLGCESAEVEIRLPLDLLIELNELYHNCDCAEFCARPDGTYYLERVMFDDTSDGDIQE